MHLLKASRVEIRFLKVNLSSFGPQSEVVFNFMAVVSDEQSRSISDNVKWAYRRLSEQGIRHIGNNRVIDYDEVDGILTHNAKAWIQKLIFMEYAAGKQVKDIIRLLDKRKAKRLRGEGSYASTNIYCILNNEMYVGDRKLQKEPHTDYRIKKPVPDGEYKSYYIENDHEGIISREIWEKVRVRFKQEEKRKSKGIYSSSNEHFIHGKLFCDKCKMPLTRKTLVYKGNKKRAWKCKGRIKDYKNCHNDVISEEELFKAFVEKLGIDWKDVEKVTEKTFDAIKRQCFLVDGRKSKWKKWYN